MATGDEYRAKAFELLTLADGENDPKIKRKFESLAFAHWRLAQEHDAGLTIEFELPSKAGNSKPN